MRRIYIILIAISIFHSSCKRNYSDKKELYTSIEQSIQSLDIEIYFELHSVLTDLENFNDCKDILRFLKSDSSQFYITLNKYISDLMRNIKEDDINPKELEQLKALIDETYANFIKFEQLLEANMKNYNNWYDLHSISFKSHYDLNIKNTNQFIEALYTIQLDNTNSYYEILRIINDNYVTDGVWFDRYALMVQNEKDSYFKNDTLLSRLYIIVYDNDDLKYYINKKRIDQRNGYGLYSKVLSQKGTFVEDLEVDIINERRQDTLRYPFQIEYEVNEK